MGIARAIRRVKRHAKQGGLNAVMTGLGEGLRSRSVPAPLRGAARKIAALIDPTRSAKTSHYAAHTAQHDTTVDHGDAGELGLERGIASPPSEVTPTGVDSGAEPSEPLEGTPVDPLAVGATPTFNATPLQVEPIDATPDEVKPIEVAPIEVSLRELPSADLGANEDGPAATDAQLDDGPVVSSAPSLEQSPPSGAKPKKNAAKKPAQAQTKPETSEPTKEKLAADGEAAKSVARSGSRAAKRRASPRAGNTSKKK